MYVWIRYAPYMYLNQRGIREITYTSMPKEIATNSPSTRLTVVTGISVAASIAKLANIDAGPITRSEA